MKIAELSVQQTDLWVKPEAPVTAGMVGAAVVYRGFGPEWEGLTKTAVFRTDQESRDVENVLAGEPVVIPWELLQQPGGELMAGICGKNRDGTVVIPTVRGSLGRIQPGSVPTDRPAQPPTPDWTARMEAQVGQALESAREAEPLVIDARAAASSAGASAATAAGHSRTAADWAEQARLEADRAAREAGIYSVEFRDVLTEPVCSRTTAQIAEAFRQGLYIDARAWANSQVHMLTLVGGAYPEAVRFVESVPSNSRRLVITYRDTGDIRVEQPAELGRTLYPLTFTGAVQGTFDGSGALTVHIPPAASEQQVSLPAEGWGKAGQYAVSDGTGGIRWVTAPPAGPAQP